MRRECKRATRARVFITEEGRQAMWQLVLVVAEGRKTVDVPGTFGKNTHH